jgi:hypothetical protein
MANQVRLGLVCRVAASSNYILIMNSFFAGQNESISRAKAIATKRKKKKIETAWNYYKIFYESNAKGMVIAQFAAIQNDIDNNYKKILMSHLVAIKKEIEKL